MRAYLTACRCSWATTYGTRAAPREAGGAVTKAKLVAQLGFDGMLAQCSAMGMGGAAGGVAAAAVAGRSWVHHLMRLPVQLQAATAGRGDGAANTLGGQCTRGCRRTATAWSLKQCSTMLTQQGKWVAQGVMHTQQDNTAGVLLVFRAQGRRELLLVYLGQRLWS